MLTIFLLPHTFNKTTVYYLLQDTDHFVLTVYLHLPKTNPQPAPPTLLSSVPINIDGLNLDAEKDSSGSLVVRLERDQWPSQYSTPSNSTARRTVRNLCAASAYLERPRVRLARDPHLGLRFSRLVECLASPTNEPRQPPSSHFAPALREGGRRHVDLNTQTQSLVGAVDAAARGSSSQCGPSRNIPPLLAATVLRTRAPTLW